MNRAMEIEQVDPQLVALLKGTAGAGLRADALTGKFSPTAPTAEEVAKSQRQARIQELWDSKPYADGRMLNMAAALELGSAGAGSWSPGPPRGQLHAPRRARRQGRG